MERSQSNTAALPQGDGADRAFDINNEPDEVTHGRELKEAVDALHGRPFGDAGVKVLVHSEKRGPAFDGRYDLGTLPSTEDMLVQSIQAHALKTAGEVLSALHRACLPDLCKTWPRLLKVAGVTSLGARRSPRQSWAFTEMREAVELALCYAEQPTSLHWQQADATIRGYARDTADAIESRLDRSDVSAESLRVAALVDSFRAFAEGK